MNNLQTYYICTSMIYPSETVHDILPCPGFSRYVHSTIRVHYGNKSLRSSCINSSSILRLYREYNWFCPEHGYK